jgi:hypothetical protein
MKFHRGDGVFAFDEVPIARIVREFNAFNKHRNEHLKFLAAIHRMKIQ